MLGCGVRGVGWVVAGVVQGFEVQALQPHECFSLDRLDICDAQQWHGMQNTQSLDNGCSSLTHQKHSLVKP